MATSLPSTRARAAQKWRLVRIMYLCDAIRHAAITERPGRGWRDKKTSSGALEITHDISDTFGGPGSS